MEPGHDMARNTRAKMPSVQHRHHCHLSLTNVEPGDWQLSKDTVIQVTLASHFHFLPGLSAQHFPQLKVLIFWQMGKELWNFEHGGQWFPPSLHWLKTPAPPKLTQQVSRPQLSTLCLLVSWILCTILDLEPKFTGDSLNLIT